jgi:SAM-dependent methyltransferase
MHRLLFWRRKLAELPSALDERPLVLPERVPFSLPKDLREVQRLDRQHMQMRQNLHGNYAAPLVAPGAILDVGCGTGRWAMEMAAEFPTAQVVGMDIVAPNPTGSLGYGIATVPPNARFIVADATQPWPFADANFDFVHMRLLYAVIPVAAWQPLLHEAVRVLRPGGWIESLESLPFPKNEREGMATIIGWFTEMLRHNGADPLIALKIPHLLRDLGLTRVAHREITSADPPPGWIASIRDAGLDLITNIRGAVLAANITTAARYDQVAEEARAELQRVTRPGGFNEYVVYGQRAAE